jgi:hypothetical protein
MLAQKIPNRALSAELLRVTATESDSRGRAKVKMRMKRGLCTSLYATAFLASAVVSRHATAQESQPESERSESEGPEAPIDDDRVAPTDEVAPAETEPPVEKEEVDQQKTVDLQEEGEAEGGKDGGRGPSGTGAAGARPQGELIQGPPEPEFDPALEPEVYWEGDSDPHNPGYVPGYGGFRGLSMNPNAPRTGAMPGGITAPINSDTWDEDWQFHFHGYMESTLKAGFGSRDVAAEGQARQTLHATPIVPGRFGDFEATQAVPGPWVQMNFSYGNPFVTATAIIAGFNQQAGAAYNYPSSQLGINDAFITLRAPDMPGIRLKTIAGAFQDRYGAMAQYSDGNYGHSIVAYTRGTGATLIGDFDLIGELVGLFEVGFKGSLDKAPIGIEPTDANGYGDAQNGAGYVGHAHLGVAFGELDVSGHFLHAFTRDDRLPDVQIRPGEPIASENENGAITTYGLTMRAIGQPYGHFFIGGAHTVARNARSVPRVINILNADGGRGLMEEYLGMRSGGNGSLTHVGFQFDTGLKQWLLHPTFFRSDSWDIRGSFFATYVHVNSDQESTNLPGFEVKFDDVNKFKVGTELLYNFAPWAGFSTRYDFVGPDLSDGERSFHIISPRLIFRTGFLAHEQINIRYTRWFYGDRTLIQTVAPNDPQGLDEHMLALQANMYW